jgi:bile acid-coenzyme A ligase
VEEISLVRRIRDNAEELGDEPVLWFVAPDGSERAWSWRELDRRSSQLAGAFAERGVELGDRVGIALRNSAELVLAIFASWKIGAVPVPMRWDLPDWELGRLESAVDARLQLGEDDLGWIAATADDEVPDLPDVISPSANGICSSGSTGLPKVIVNNKPAVLDTAVATPFIAAWGVQVPSPQVLMVLGPMYHVNGFSSVHPLVNRERVVVMERFDAAAVVDAIERHRVTGFNCTPTMLKRIADLPDIDDRDLSSIVAFVQGAAPMPPYLVHRWAELIGAEHFILAYGMTEQLGVFAIRGDEWMDHEGSVGRPIRGTEVKILGADGEELPVGEIGDIYMRSTTYKGSTYLGDVPQTPSTADGFRTVGDLGHVDADGFLYLVDRRVDMIITGGVNVYPAEVEAALSEHPEVADVVVIGLKDDEWGRRVHAVIAPRDPADPPTLDEVRDFARARLHPYKVPKSIELVDEVPRSAATKVNRGALVEARGG